MVEPEALGAHRRRRIGDTPLAVCRAQRHGQRLISERDLGARGTVLDPLVVQGAYGAHYGAQSTCTVWSPRGRTTAARSSVALLPLPHFRLLLGAGATGRVALAAGVWPRRAPRTAPIVEGA